MHTRGVLGRFPKFRYHNNCIALPQGLIRATVSLINQNVVQLTGWNEHYFHEEILFNMSSSEEWILDQIDRDVQLNACLALSIYNQQIHIVCNGSYYKEHNAGGAAWYIESLDRSDLTCGCTVAPGSPEVQSSARSELMGILGSIMHINYICNRFDIQQGKATLHCDNKGAVNSLNNKHDIIKNSRKHFDFYQSINAALEHSPIQWQFLHIEGHQDELHQFEELSRPHQLNVLADLKAKETVLQAIENNTLHQYRLRSLPYCTVEIRVCSQLQSSIKYHCSSVQIKQYWLNKHQMEDNVINIDWDLKSKSHNNSTKTFNRWLSKHSIGFCGVGKMLKRYNYQSHTSCPRCGRTQETTSHVLQCKQDSACQLWDKEVSNLHNWMIKQKMQPLLAEIITHNISAWKYSTQINQLLPQNQHLCQALLQQDRIGWKQFIEGFWSKSWRKCQQQHFDNIHSPNSSLLLLSKTQRRIWRITWEMWQHRNNHLHGDLAATPAVERTSIDDEVTTEWNLGISTLSAHYRHLFQGSLEEKLQKSYHNKRVWLAMVWAARETLDINYLSNNPTQLDTTIRLRYEQWKQRHQRNQALHQQEDEE